MEIITNIYERWNIMIKLLGLNSRPMYGNVR